uniref:WGS project CBMI000000000 data, contig CS3069_c004916 n=1 Tax=Fusarium clavum TaxID=2594811 RepID=A0A090N653_9HYPO|nr:unnamed protein product [Fusarium clavum]
MENMVNELIVINSEDNSSAAEEVDESGGGDTFTPASAWVSRATQPVWDSRSSLRSTSYMESCVDALIWERRDEI